MGKLETGEKERWDGSSVSACYGKQAVQRCGDNVHLSILGCRNADGLGDASGVGKWPAAIASESRVLLSCQCVARRRTRSSLQRTNQRESSTPKPRLIIRRRPLAAPAFENLKQVDCGVAILMRNVQSRNRLVVLRAVWLAALAVATAATVADADAQPYYFQPPPSYYHNDTAAGTFVGGALGAITGAVVGGRSHRGEGALIGAGVGALTGNVLGRAQDRADERQAATGAAMVAGANQQATAMAVTNYDLISMTKAGVSDDVIVSTMQSRGTRLDLSPQGLIALKQSGVSDRVLLSAQNLGSGPAFVAGPPPAVLVAPARPRYYFYGPRPYYRAHYYYHFH